MDDGHTIPTYAASSETPRPSGGDGLPLNSEDNGAGACDYCHSTGTGSPFVPGIDTVSGILVHSNSRTHHYTGLGNNVDNCYWCHNLELEPEYRIRTCEGCHGFESLHNIQVDSDGDGVINPGDEISFYGHVGNPDDCWGCHGYYEASLAPGTGPIAPDIIGSDTSVVTAGHDTTVILSGSAFTNLDDGVELLSNIVLTSSDGSEIELTPDSINEATITVTIPGSLSTGNYRMRAVKETSGSNSTVVSVKPEVTITDVDCKRKKGVLTITGTGFSEKIEGTDAYISAKYNGDSVDIISWTDTRIRAFVSRCSTSAVTTVNSLFGSATKNGNGKPPKPCKGKGCNK
jgi:hypothetical protein